MSNLKIHQEMKKPHITLGSDHSRLPESTMKEDLEKALIGE